MSEFEADIHRYLWDEVLVWGVRPSLRLRLVEAIKAGMAERLFKSYSLATFPGFMRRVISENGWKQ